MESLSVQCGGRNAFYLLMMTCLLALTSTIEATKGNEKVVCYYSSWAHYRKGAAKFTVEDVPVELCTHVIYAFAVLDGNSLTTVQHDQWLEGRSGLDNYGRFLQLKERNPEAKLLLGLGGWTDSRSDKYSRMVSDPQSRRAFTSHVISFLQDYGFDGLDLDWEYPAYQSSPQDRQGFQMWVGELSAAFKPLGLLLTAAVAAGKSTIDNGYNIPAVAKSLDQIHLMAYDFHGSWEKKVGHHAPLFPAPGQPNELTADFAVNYWIKKGAPPAKIVLGVPFYGRSWTLAGSESSSGAPASGAGRPGPLMKDAGTLAYYEVCLAEKDGWQKVSGQDGPYLTNGNQWVGYDDVSAIERKTQYAKDKGLGGIMIWDIALDDFKGSCGSGINPLLSAISRTLSGVPAGITARPTLSTFATRPSTPAPRPPSTSTARSFTTPHITSTPRPSYPQHTPPSTQLNVDECINVGYSPDPLSCSHFYRCSGNQIFHFECYKGLHWRQSKGACDWPKSALCKSSSTLRIKPDFRRTKPF